MLLLRLLLFVLLVRSSSLFSNFLIFLPLFNSDTRHIFLISASSACCIFRLRRLLCCRMELWRPRRRRLRRLLRLYTHRLLSFLLLFLLLRLLLLLELSLRFELIIDLHQDSKEHLPLDCNS